MKPNCSNLQIGDLESRTFFDPTNTPGYTTLRWPLYLQFNQDSGSSESREERPERETETPDRPNQPDPRPEPPTTPRPEPTPDSVSSTPGSGIGTDTGAPGYSANHVP